MHAVKLVSKLPFCLVQRRFVGSFHNYLKKVRRKDPSVDLEKGDKFIGLSLDNLRSKSPKKIRKKKKKGIPRQKKSSYVCIVMFFVHSRDNQRKPSSLFPTVRYENLLWFDDTNVPNCLPYLLKPCVSSTETYSSTIIL